MKKTASKIIFSLLVMCILFSVGAINAFAISWDGSSGGGGGGGVPAGPNGYAVRTTGDNCIGYRFSVVNKHGGTKNGAVIDVFRNSYVGNLAYSSGHKFYTKYNKKQLINNQNSGYSTGSTTSGCLKEANMGFGSSLPAPSGMGSWQNSYSNLNPVLNNLGVYGGVGALVNGDKVIVEPLYDVRLKGTYHAVTTTELAIYGKWILGANSNGGSSSNSGSWGFISSYTNKHYPNYLYTPDGQGLWNGVGKLSSRATFYNIINKGYGVGIAYTETKPDFTPTLSVRCVEAWPGSKGNRNNHFGISYGSTFSNYVYGNGYPTKGNKVWFAVNFPAESENCYVRQTVWVDGGGQTSRNVYSNNGTWYDVSLSPTTVDVGRSSYIVKARVDWIDGNGNVKKWGSEKTFYIPIKPQLNRYQVTMYDINGTQVARNGSLGQSGAVYVGQRVQPKYTYTSSNTWTSYNQFSNTINGTKDLSTSGGINSYSSFESYSNRGYYRVPNISTIPCQLTTAWNSDTARTTETTGINIPVVKSDVELRQIRLVDQNGYYVTKVYQGQKVTPQYTYKNNTNLKIYVDGYDNNRNKIGTYAIPAYGSINVSGTQITVTSSGTVSVWGGVYLEGAGIYNTSWETVGTNNQKTLGINISKPISLELIDPVYSYREGTSVITSYKVKNSTELVFLPNSLLTVNFYVYNGNTLIYSGTKSSVVIPAYGDNLVYFKWNVPKNGLSEVRMYANLYTNGYQMYNRTDYNSVIPPNSSITPDTRFEKKAPSDFNKLTPSNNTTNTSANWSEWVYKNEEFKKKTYNIKINSVSNTIVPDVNCLSRKQVSGVWQMGSGYGFTSDLFISLGTNNGYLSPNTGAYTNAQTASMFVPEFKYITSQGKYRAFISNGINRFQLPSNSYATGNAKLHFVPLWYPNAPYITRAYVHDLWSPAGMLNGYYNSNTINIYDSAYDDWYIGR